MDKITIAFLVLLATEVILIVTQMILLFMKDKSNPENDFPALFWILIVLKIVDCVIGLVVLLRNKNVFSWIYLAALIISAIFNFILLCVAGATVVSVLFFILTLATIGLWVTLYFLDMNPKDKNERTKKHKHGKVDES